MRGVHGEQTRVILSDFVIASVERHEASESFMATSSLRGDE